MWYSNDILFSRKCNKLMVLCLICILGIPSKSERIDNKLFLYIICIYICNKIYINIYIYTHHERDTCIIIKVYTKYEQCDFKFMK